MFMVEIWVYCVPPWKFGCPKILQLQILGTQFLNPGLVPDDRYLTVSHFEGEIPISIRQYKRHTDYSDVVYPDYPTWRWFYYL